MGIVCETNDTNDDVYILGAKIIIAINLYLSACR